MIKICHTALFYTPLLVLNLILNSAHAEENGFNNNHIVTEESWLTYHLKEKDVPQWAIDYILALDSKIQDSSTRTYFRRFVADPGNRFDSITKFIEYLSLAGYPEAIISDKQNSSLVLPEAVYKAVYFAITYTIMDGLPDGPLQRSDSSNTAQSTTQASSVTH
ncbi:MAG: hypothetical protein P4L16_04925 [Chlamydiales bacterium]|nr:hypothetical protein [Chlamydiales bacterium]